MNIQLEVKKVVVLSGVSGSDEIHLTLDGPTPYPVIGDEGVATIITARGYGLQWCREVLKVEPEVLKCP
jgi:hypothetical protein